MSWIDWLIVLIPFSFVMYMAWNSRKYVRGVADFLVAGRVCGRYVISVSDATDGLCVLALVAGVEVAYKTGFLVGFWRSVMTPLSIFLSLTGFCVYRYRETCALSMGQFLEMRYNKSLRVCASVIRTLSEMLANMICPAVAARFFIYLLNLPIFLNIFGFQMQTFTLILFGVILLALFFILFGGSISLVITDTLQMLISYPIFVVFTIFILCQFSWFDQIEPVMMDRVPTESFLNPFDIKGLRDFNLFSVLVTMINLVLNRASWFGGQGTAAAKNAHEQKMAGILGAWRSGFAWLFFSVVGLAMIVYLNHRDFAEDAKIVRDTTSKIVITEIIDKPALRDRIIEKVEQIPVQRHVIGKDEKLSQKKNLETVYMNTVHQELGDTGKGNALFQQFRTLYQQMLISQTMRKILPVGLLGLFVLLMIMLMVSTDDTRIFNSGLTIMQDIILPNMKRKLTPPEHLRYLKWSCVGVGIFFFVVSRYMAQLDYIRLFCTIMTSIWLCGAGPIITFGLYTRWGNSTGAFCSLIFGSGFAVSGIFLQRNWPDVVYPFLQECGWVEPLGRLMSAVTKPFHPYVVWEMDPVKFPVNSNEIFFLGMFIGILAYAIGSFAAWKGAFDLDKLLHRGKYLEKGKVIPKVDWSPRGIFKFMLGITPQYTTGDKVIAWSVFLWSLCFSFGFCFVGIVIWSQLSSWNLQDWGKYFLIFQLILPCVIGLISTVWFMIGGIVDLRKMFADLKNRKDNPDDNGVVDKN